MALSSYNRNKKSFMVEFLSQSQALGGTVQSEHPIWCHLLITQHWQRSAPDLFEHPHFTNGDFSRSKPTGPRQRSGPEASSFSKGSGWARTTNLGETQQPGQVLGHMTPGTMKMQDDSDARSDCHTSLEPMSTGCPTSCTYFLEFSLSSSLIL